MEIEVKIDDLSDEKVFNLLDAHLQEMHKYSPPESIHALDRKKLKDNSITFFSARCGDVLLGCGAIKALSSASAELKSMKTDPKFLRQGVAIKILEEIISEAKRRSYSSVSLETGTNSAFEPAVKLYTRFGFLESGPFGDYKRDPYSRFYTLKLGKL